MTKNTLVNRPSRRATWTTVALAAMGSLLLAACGSDDGSSASGSTSAPTSNAPVDPAWQAVVDAATKEGKVVLYTSSDGYERTLPPVFEKQYPGIKLEVVHFASGALTSKLDAEKTTGAAGADVAVHSTKPWWDANKAALTAIKGPDLAKYWAGTKYVFGDNTFVLSGALQLGAGINTEVASELKLDPIKTYKDLLQPKLQGQIGIVPGKGAPAAEQWWFYASQELGDGGLDKLAALKPRAYAGGTAPLATDIGSGEVAVGVYQTKAAVANLKKAGAPIEFVALDPPITIGGFSGILANAKNPNAAQVLENWLISPAGQIAAHGEGDTLTPLPLDKLGNVPATMQSVPSSGKFTDGILTAEQKAFYDGKFTSLFG
jgi:iron(III) transport system substrate-binding protein